LFLATGIRVTGKCQPSEQLSFKRLSKPTSVCLFLCLSKNVVIFQLHIIILWYTGVNSYIVSTLVMRIVSGVSADLTNT